MASKSVELTKKQQHHTLSAKKKKAKKTFRYALAQPFPRYWPQLKEEQSQQLHDLLKGVHVKHPEWFAGKKSYSSNKSIFCGLQSSIRNLKTGQMKLLVLSADLKPRYVANQIILQALACNEDIRILCVSNLANLTRILLNYSCYAFVVSDINWSELTELDKWTAEIIREHFPLPSIIKAHFAKRRENKTSDPMEVDEPQAKQLNKRLSDSNVEHVNISCLHLTRSNLEANQRAFVPKNGINLKPITLEIESLNKIKSDFISLNTFDNSNDDGPSNQINITHKYSQKKGKRPLTMYRELTIHRVQNNPGKANKFKNKNKKNKKK